MTAASGTWNREAAGNTVPHTTAMDNSADSSGGTSAGSEASISSNDFLRLLVTEMQNQDPTATTDPNEYINQLVNVNSLQQLISINQTLSGALGVSPGAADPSTAPAPRQAGTD
jgi:flagellar basal-body rod modification protein FlgD